MSPLTVLVGCCGRQRRQVGTDMCENTRRKERRRSLCRCALLLEAKVRFGGNDCFLPIAVHQCNAGQWICTRNIVATPRVFPGVAVRRGARLPLDLGALGLFLPHLRGTPLDLSRFGSWLWQVSFSRHHATRCVPNA
jgi:hypothetical protein